MSKNKLSAALLFYLLMAIPGYCLEMSQSIEARSEQSILGHILGGVILDPKSIAEHFDDIDLYPKVIGSYTVTGEIDQIDMSANMLYTNAIYFYNQGLYNESAICTIQYINLINQEYILLPCVLALNVKIYSAGLL